MKPMTGQTDGQMGFSQQLDCTTSDSGEGPVLKPGDSWEFFTCWFLVPGCAHRVVRRQVHRQSLRSSSSPEHGRQGIERFFPLPFSLRGPNSLPDQVSVSQEQRRFISNKGPFVNNTLIAGPGERAPARPEPAPVVSQCDDQKGQFLQSP